jgi:hypothetical protein
LYEENFKKYMFLNPRKYVAKEGKISRSAQKSRF